MQWADSDALPPAAVAATPPLSLPSDSGAPAVSPYALLPARSATSARSSPSLPPATVQHMPPSLLHAAALPMRGISGADAGAGAGSAPAAATTAAQLPASAQPAQPAQSQAQGQPQSHSSTRAVAALGGRGHSSRSKKSASHSRASAPAPAAPAPAAPAPSGWDGSMYDQPSERDDSSGDEDSGADAAEGSRNRRYRRGSSDSDHSDSDHSHLKAGSSGSGGGAGAARPSKHDARKQKHMRRTIDSGLRGLSAEALKRVDQLVRQLQQQEQQREQGGADGPAGVDRKASLQVEGASRWMGEAEDAPSSSSSSDSDADASPARSGRKRRSPPLPPPHSAQQASSNSSSGRPSNAVQQVLSSSPLLASPGGALPSLGMQRSWNAEFQSCFSAICNDSTILDNAAGYSALSSLAHDFIWTASTLGRIIISEMQLPPAHKTIPSSAQLGGVAGGVKYVAHNLVFKFAVDQKGLYGGDQFAAKAAGHELLGLSSYYRSIASAEGRLGLHVPLAALIDFRGYRLYAVSKLPIDGARTLVLGSGDAGRSIHNDSPELDSKMRAVAQMLNLRPHALTDPAGRTVTLASPFDIEGHQGRDGRFYLVDFHRTFPPEPPPNVLRHQVANEHAAAAAAAAAAATAATAAGLPAPPAAAPAASPFADLLPQEGEPVLQNSYLYRLLRPELVRQSPTPLSSDAFSTFDRVEMGHQADVLAAFRGLVERVVPAFARSLERLAPPTRFVDSGVQMQQQTQHMIRTSSGGGGGAHAHAHSGASASASAYSSMQTPRMSRSPSLSSLVSGQQDPFAGVGGFGSASASAFPSSSSSMLPPPPTLSLDVLSSVLHQSGINVRYLGLVRHHMRCLSWRKVILVEILARLLKNELRARWRAVKLRSMSDGPFRAAAVQFLNLIFYPSLASSTYWAQHVHPRVNTHFPGTFRDEERDPAKFDLKASLQQQQQQQPQQQGHAQGTGDSHRASPDHSASPRSCPVHHQTHTHAPVDPADPLSFLPPLSAAVNAASANAHSTASGATPSPGGSGSSSARSPSSSPDTTTGGSDHPSLGRSPSVPTGGFKVPAASPMVGRSVSTSAGYVAQQSHLPSSRTTHAHHHRHSGSFGTQPPPVSITSPHAHAHTPLRQTDPSSGSGSSAAASGSKASRPLDLQHPLPEVPCPGLGCCSSGGQVDYLLLLFMRLIQLSGIVLEDGITEAIQQAADKQTQADAERANANNNNGARDDSAPDTDASTLVRQESLDVDFPAMDSSLVGEGSLHLVRSAASQRGASGSISGVGSIAGLGMPTPLHHRAVTEPRAMHDLHGPPTPPPLQHAASSRDVLAGGASLWPLPSANGSQSQSSSRLASSPAPTRRLGESGGNGSGGGGGGAPGGAVLSRVPSHSNLSVAPLSILHQHPSAFSPSHGHSNSWYKGQQQQQQQQLQSLSSAPSTPATPHSQSGINTPTDSTGYSRSRSGSFVGSRLMISASVPFDASQRGVTGGGGGGGASGSGVGSGSAVGDSWNLWSWPFVAPLEEMHVQGLVERIKQVNLLWYAEGTSLLIKAWEKLQQHNRWVAEHGPNAAFTAVPAPNSAKESSTSAGAMAASSMSASASGVAAPSRNTKRFFLSGHMQTDAVFTAAPTPYLQMAFHLAGLATSKFQHALRYCLDDNLTLANLSFLMSAVYTKFASAMSYLRRAVAANPQHVRSLYYQAQLYHYHLKDRANARACYEAALSLAPHQSHANALKDYGNLMQFHFGQAEQAEALYRRALQAEPRHIKSLQMLASLRMARMRGDLHEYDEIKRLLYDAARSPMGVVETRLHAQVKYLHFTQMQAELFAEEHQAIRAEMAKAATTTTTTTATGVGTPTGAGGAASGAGSSSGGSGSSAPASTSSSSSGAGPLSAELREAKKRWRESIDFLQCPHLHLGSARDSGDDATTTNANNGRGAGAGVGVGAGSAPPSAGGAMAGGLVSLSLPSQAATQLHAQLAAQYLVTSTVIRPVPPPQPVVAHASVASSLSPQRSPSLSRAASEDSRSHSATAAAAAGKGSMSLPSAGQASASASAATAASDADLGPSAGFSFCVCADCCGVNSASLPLADTLLSYAQFIAHFEAVPQAGQSSAQAASFVHGRMVEAAKYHQWAIHAHHTLVASRKAHKQAQMQLEMHPELMAAQQAAPASADFGAAGSIYTGAGSLLQYVASRQPNPLTKDGTVAYQGRSSTAHDVLPPPSPHDHVVFPPVPPVVKVAYLISTPASGAGGPVPGPLGSPAGGAATSPPSLLASASNSSVSLEQRTPWLSSSWIAGLGVAPNFNVVVSKPFPMKPKQAPASAGGAAGGAAAGEAAAERRLNAMAKNSRSSGGGGASGSVVAVSTIFSSIAGAGAGALGGGGLFITAPGSSPAPALVATPVTGPGVAAATTAGMVAGAVSAGGVPASVPVLPRPPSSWDSATPKKWAAVAQQPPLSAQAAAAAAAAHAANVAQTHKELQHAEWSFETDLERDAQLIEERRCDCAVDHSWGEAATACRCSFPSPRYLVCYGFFLLRNQCAAAAAYIFQAALAVHPFGRAGSTCMARMLASVARGGALVPSSASFNANLKTLYALWQKAVGFEPLVTTASDDAGSPSAAAAAAGAGAYATLTPSTTALRLFDAFLKEHGAAVGPTAAAAATPVPTTAGAVPTLTSTSTPAGAAVGTGAGAAAGGATSGSSSVSGASTPLSTVGPVLSGVGAMQSRVSRLLSDLENELKAHVDASYSGAGSRDRPVPSFALALHNKHCKCLRPRRGKACVCNYAIIKLMITQVRSMRERKQKQRAATASGFVHHDAATHAHARRQQARGGGAGGGGGATHFNATGSGIGYSVASGTGTARGGGGGGGMRGGRGGVRGGMGHSSLARSSAEARKQRESAMSSRSDRAADRERDGNSSDSSAKSEEASASAGAAAAGGSAPTREGSGVWAQAVLKGEITRDSAAAAAGAPRRTATMGGANHATLAKEKTGAHGSTSSSSSTPAGSSITTPASSSPLLSSLAMPSMAAGGAASNAAMFSLASLSLPAHVVTTAPATATAAVTMAATNSPGSMHAPNAVVGAPASAQPQPTGVVLPHLPTSAWNAPPSVLAAPAPAPPTSAAPSASPSAAASYGPSAYASLPSASVGFAAPIPSSISAFPASPFGGAAPPAAANSAPPVAAAGAASASSFFSPPVALFSPPPASSVSPASAAVPWTAAHRSSGSSGGGGVAGSALPFKRSTLQKR